MSLLYWLSRQSAPQQTARSDADPDPNWRCPPSSAAPSRVLLPKATAQSACSANADTGWTPCYFGCSKEFEKKLSLANGPVTSAGWDGGGRTEQQYGCLHKKYSSWHVVTDGL